MFRKSKEQKSKEELDEKLAKRYSSKMERLCNFYFERDGYSPMSPKRHECFLVGGFATLTCAGEDCIFVRLLKKLEAHEHAKG